MGLRVAELFAGVGGFRLGLHEAGHQVVWWNQWEPATKTVQHAYECYVRRFHGDFVGPIAPSRNRDIKKVRSDEITDHDLLVGGFPCQDYSVAAPLRHSKGLRGKKGGLWWEINRVLEDKRTPYVVLENVDRLLSSPKKRRGRDFSVLLSCLARMGYAVEWRVINAADYGQPQRRRRVFIFAARLRSDAGKYIRANASRADYLSRRGFFAKEFPVVQEPAVPAAREPSDGRLDKDPRTVSRKRLFLRYENAGVMVGGRIWTERLDAEAETPRPKLRAFVAKGASEDHYVPRRLHALWRKAKRQKAVLKTARLGYQYWYNEGSVPFPDSLKEPARTLLTGEGSTGPSRSNHIIRDPWTKRYRILTPEECEALMGFPRGHTEGLPRRWRYFVMGNAVVVGVVKRIGDRVSEFLESTKGQPSQARESRAVAARLV